MIRLQIKKCQRNLYNNLNIFYCEFIQKWVSYSGSILSFSGKRQRTKKVYIDLHLKKTPRRGIEPRSPA